MRLNLLLLHKLKTIGLLCLFSMFAGCGYQYLNEGFIDYNGPLVGLFLGLGFSSIEMFLMSKLDNRLELYPVLLILIIKSFTYTSIVFLISNILTFLSGYFDGKQAADIFRYLFSSRQFYIILYSLIIISIITFVLQIGKLMGRHVLWRFLLGKYIKPVEEERIFMFLDLKSSTTIAEKIGHKKFYAFLNSFFHEISEPVLLTKAEIYQYVGDEVVITWKVNDGIKEANCVRIFFMIKENIMKKHNMYLKKYGNVPKFKAGLHFGRVMIGQIGEIKKEIVYNGDVLNTTSRIQSLCNDYNQELLISRSLLIQLKLPDHYVQEYQGKVSLKGKKEEINLYVIKYE